MPEADWTVRGTREALRAVRTLIDAHSRLRSISVTEVTGTAFVEMSANGVTGLVPNHAGLSRFSKTAAIVCNRAGAATGPVALLAQWDERAVEAAEAAGKFAPASYFWPARLITGRDLPQAIGVGFGALLYFGHGSCGGWDGYWGVPAATLIAPMSEPAGAVLSLTCLAAKRRPDGLSFCEELVLGGYCAAAYGSAGRTSHRRNRTLGEALCRAMQEHTTLAGMLQNCQASWLSRAGYTVIGDPLACLAGSAEASGHANRTQASFWLPASNPIPAELIVQSLREVEV